MSLATFTRNVVADFASTAAVAPSSRHLARAMVEPVSRNALRTAVELGPGTGAMTHEILRHMHPDGILLAFEISPRFVDHLQRTIRDQRLHVIHAGAETAGEELQRRGIDKIDGAVSSLGIGLMDEALAGSIYASLLPSLRDGGVLTQFQYVHRVRMRSGRLEHFDAGKFLEQYFGCVETSRVWLNLPPAYVLTCSDGRTLYPTRANESAPNQAARSAKHSHGLQRS